MRNNYSRRKFIKSVGFGAVSLALPDLMVPSGRSENRPNIIFVMSDDHAYQAISSYGSKINKTPNIDRLAKEGTRFEQSFVTNSICAPSRAVLLTGKYSHLNGMIDNGTTFDGNQQTFTKILQKNGYQTAMVGKWHLKSQPTGFDYWNILPGQGHYYNPDFIEMGRKKRVEGYVTDLTTDFALNWVNKRDRNKPFCLLLHHKAPHRNWMPGPDHLEKYENTRFPEPDTLFDNFDGRGSAARDQNMEISKDMYLDYDLKVDSEGADKELFENEKVMGKWWNKVLSRMTPDQRERWNRSYGPRKKEFKRGKLEGEKLIRWKYQNYMRDYLRCIASLDDNIGRMIDYLKGNDLYEDTLIIYTSDQGFYLGEHGWFDKRFMYEESHRMPLIIKAPGQKKGKVSSDMVLNLDFAPTILDYAGVKIPGDIQGKSLKNIIQGKTPADWRRSVYYHYYEHPSPHNVKRHYGIRTSRYKLIHFYYDIDEWELYDLKKDPQEMNNVYNNADYQNIIIELKEELQKLRKKYKDTDETKFLPGKNRKINHKGVGAKITFKYPYDKKYPGNNPNALADGWQGPDKYYSGVDYSVWQGFKKNDLIATIDFGKEIEINSVSAGFLHNIESWIFLPDAVEFSVSNDTNFKSIGKVKRKMDIKSTLVLRKEFELKTEGICARYLKIHAKNIGFCPNWHKGAGEKGWLFADEIIVK
ncbi:MAG: sulfatase/phosphatase domain-containing protein [Acidobacteriota bacterium]